LPLHLPCAGSRPLINFVGLSQMRFLILGAFALSASACAASPLPELSPTDAASPDAPVISTPYRPVMAGTAAYGPVELKPWRELNDSVAPAGSGLR
jgi:hypothetical protein